MKRVEKGLKDQYTAQFKKTIFFSQGKTTYKD